MAIKIQPFQLLDGLFFNLREVKRLRAHLVENLFFLHGNRTEFLVWTVKSNYCQRAVNYVVLGDGVALVKTEV